MATYITRQTLTPLQGGSRLDPTVDTLSGEAPSGTQSDTSVRYTGNTGLMSTLLIGSRSFNVGSQQAVAFMGTGVETLDRDPERTYQMLQEIGIGQREPYNTGQLLVIDERVTGERVNVIRSGVGSFGIQYQQTIIQNSDKRIRRWPRDWHGDNMN